jgi:hypothetical protein
MIRRLSIIAVALGALAFAGCGGGDTTSSGDSAKQLTKAELIKQGDEICAQMFKRRFADVNAYLAKKPQAANSDSGKEEMVVVAILPSVQPTSEKLDALSPPDGDEGAYEEILQGIADALKQAEEDPLSVLPGGSDPFAVTRKDAGLFGFKLCSNIL